MVAMMITREKNTKTLRPERCSAPASSFASFSSDSRRKTLNMRNIRSRRMISSGAVCGTSRER